MRKKEPERIVIGEDLVHLIDEVLKTQPGSGYKSKSDFIDDAVRARLVQLRLDCPSGLVARWTGSASDFILRIMKEAESVFDPRLERDHVVLQARTQGMSVDLANKTIDWLLNNGIIYNPVKGFIKRAQWDGTTKRPLQRRRRKKQPLSSTKVKPDMIPELAVPLELTHDLSNWLGHPDYAINDGGVLLSTWYAYRTTLVFMIGRVGLPNEDVARLDYPPVLFPLISKVLEEIVHKAKEYSKEWLKLIEQLGEEEAAKRTDLI